MSNFTGIINSEMKRLHREAITEVLRGCSVDCELIYGVTKYEDCPNCIFSNITGKSTNKYQAGGPIPFTFGKCPYCFGVGRKATETSVEIKLCPIYDYKSWITTIDTKITSPEGFVQTLSTISTRAKIIQAKEIIIDTALDTSTRPRFERYGEPQPCGIGGSDFIATMWKRIENG